MGGGGAGGGGGGDISYFIGRFPLSQSHCQDDPGTDVDTLSVTEGVLF